ncbi:sensor histidine kinase [Paucibacter sp. DJ2R-2]|uniref:sensor histidine kinase n=1 Tax=Paucibacter sp. DJ2R-2 TaxID=2893558 RepID=UPI0021E406A5|nr:HAMP domain-containing sensor histidine kinase [Paucibacter sp. DJ2R-2]MCV2422290.1 HAMP domain-containing histidine kinase [Paucibacter sp. DJ4R-1]MCV2440126.1 HAMP domain-containing histidine kinase [Paucibacter sp. DJ2R-2]
MSSHLPSLIERSNWLKAQWHLYGEAPCSAEALIEPALRLYEDQVLMERPSEFGVLLTLFLCELLQQVHRREEVATLVERALAWAGLDISRREKVALLSWQCRMHSFFQRQEEALTSLAQLSELTRNENDPLLLAQHRRVLAMSLFAQREYRHSIELYRETIELYRLSGDVCGWIGLFTLIAQLHRRLGERDAMLAAYIDCVAGAVAQRRWVEASNASTGIAEEYAERGEHALAERALKDARDLAGRASTLPVWMELELCATEAVLCALKEDKAGAVVLMRKAIESGKALGWRDMSQRLRQIVPWLLELRQGEEAVAALERAHGLELEAAHEVGRKHMAIQLRLLEVDHAKAEQARSATHASELAARNQALEQALAKQYELQTELIEASKLATLGSLLAGMSHELNTPLGTTLVAVSTLADMSRQLGNQVRQGTISRKGFERDIGACEQGAELARRSVESAIKLIESYQQLNATHSHEHWVEVQLDEVIRATWDRSIDPRSPLRIEVDANLCVSVHLEAFTEVLRQLLQNVERHAYAVDEPGVVQVQACVDGEQILLTVSDTGRGIDPELLPRVFDPYVTSQFGKGRSGLGLFVARAAAGQKMLGKLRVQSELGLGSRFELVWPSTPASL